MKQRSRRSVLRGLGLAGSLVIAGCGSDPELTETPTPTASAAFEESWRVEYERPSPVVVDGDTVYFGTAHGVLGASPGQNRPIVAVDAPSGAVRWELLLGDGLSTPRLADGTLYATTSEGYLRALRPMDGEERWHYRYASTDDYHGSYRPPAVAGGVVATQRFPYEDLASSRIVGVDARSRERRFRIEPATDLLGAPESGGFVAVAAGALRSYDTAGRERWAAGSERAIGDAALAGDRVYALLDGGTLWAIDAATGEGLWERDAEGASEIVVSDGSVYVLAEGGVRSIARDGGERWRRELPELFRGELTRFGEYVAASTDERVVGLDAATGRERWAIRPANGAGWLTGQYPHLYVGSGEGLVRFEHVG